MGRRSQKLPYFAVVLIVCVAAVFAAKYFLSAPIKLLQAVNAPAMVPDPAPNQSITSQPTQPGTLVPSKILANQLTPQPELLAWARDWETSHAMPTQQNQTSEAMGEKLKGIIESSDLSAIDCLRVAKLVSDKMDFPGGETWMNVGVDRAEQEIGTLASDDPSANPVLNAMGDNQAPLWDRGEKNALLLEKMAALTLRFNRSGPWSQRPEWARIGHAEALYLQHRNDESLKEADVMVADMAKPDSQFRPEQKAGVHWIRALVLLDQRKDALAVSDLEAVISCKTFHHTPDAWPAYVRTLAKCHQTDKAKTMFDTYVQQFHPSIDDSMALATVIADGEVTAN